MGDSAATFACPTEHSFFACYLLCSLNPRFKGRTYIGFTVNPKRRIRQHNGEITSGARRTQKKRPWEMVLCVHGFPSNVHALQFEWAWQHPTKSLAVRDAASKIKRRGVRGQVLLLFTMLNLPEWNSMNLVVNFLSTKHQTLTKGCPTLPVQMQVKVGPLDGLPCYDSSYSELSASDGFESGSDEDLHAAQRKGSMGTIISAGVGLDISPVRSPEDDEGLPAALSKGNKLDKDLHAAQRKGSMGTIISTGVGLDISPLRSPEDDEDLPAARSKGNKLDDSHLLSPGDEGSPASTSLMLDVSPLQSFSGCVSHLPSHEDEVLPASTSIMLDLSPLQSSSGCVSHLPFCKDEDSPSKAATSIVLDLSPLQTPCGRDTHAPFIERSPKASPPCWTPLGVVADKENGSNKKRPVPASATYQFTPLWSPSPLPAEQEGVESMRNADMVPFKLMEMNCSFGLSPSSCFPIPKPTGASFDAGLSQPMTGGSSNSKEIIDLTDSPAYESLPTIKKFTYV